MEDSGAILCQISCLKQMLDQVNEEFESSIQTTRDIESQLFKCSEMETALCLRESELTKIKCLSEFELDGFLQVSRSATTSLQSLEDELSLLRIEKDKAVQRMANKREAFIILCREFQRDISNGDNDELQKLLSEKEVLESEMYNLNTKVDALQNSVSAFVEEIIEDLQYSNSALQVDIRCRNLENKKVLEDIEQLKSSLLAISSSRNHH